MRMRTGVAAHAAWLVAALLVGVPAPASPQDDVCEQRLANWLNCKIDLLVQDRIGKGEGTKQSEAPTISGNTTSLVDQASISDLLGLAVNLAGLSGATGGDDDPTSTALSLNLYTLRAGLSGADPLDPGFYRDNSDWRRVSLTVGFDNEEGADEDRVTVLGGKVLLLNQRDPGARHNASRLEEARKALTGTATAFANLTIAVEDLLYERTHAHFGISPVHPDSLEPDSDRTAADIAAMTPEERALEALEDAQDQFFEEVLIPRFSDVLTQVEGTELEGEIEALVDQYIDVFVVSAERIRDVVQAISRQPQLSVAYNGKLRRDGSDEHSAEAIFEYGLQNRLNLTFNGAYEVLDRKIEDDLSGGKAALQLAFLLAPIEALGGKKPMSFNLAAHGKWMSEVRPEYKLQAKLLIPLSGGIDLPVSLTWANRAELIDEAEIRGQVGFTLDLAKLMAARQ